MKKALFITSFNDPASASISMKQFSPLFQDCEKILSDQSTDENCIAQYKELCQQYGFIRLSNKNEGASGAKRKIIEIANFEGFELMHQISEDFELVPDGEQNPSCPNGQKSFITDATSLVSIIPSLSFVHWTWFRHNKHIGYFWNLYRPANIAFNRHSCSSLAFLTGEVSLFNWPYTGLVNDLVHIQKKASRLTPMTEQERKDNIASGGEWAQAKASLGHGASLFAHPVRHRTRNKHPDSLP